MVKKVIRHWCPEKSMNDVHKVAPEKLNELFFIPNGSTTNLVVYTDAVKKAELILPRRIMRLSGFHRVAIAGFQTDMIVNIFEIGLSLDAVKKILSPAKHPP